jgi:hypothetical protein
MARSERPVAAPNEIVRSSPPRSSSTTSTGAATARGAIVSTRYRATLSLASPTGREKNTESARAIATSVSPAELERWTIA